MKALRNILNKLERHFLKGGKLARLYPLYEAADSFIYTPGGVTLEAPHVRDAIDLKRVMITVVVALLPCFFMAMWNTGFQANSAMLLTGGSIEGWRGAMLAILGYTANPDSMLDNLLLGAAWFLPIYLVTISSVVCGRRCSVLSVGTRLTRGSWSLVHSFR
jgi:Na+-transporting NADH:ubiquinone oxidoreductase subunit B